MPSATLPTAQELLEGIRNALTITWNDAYTNQSLTGIIARGIAFLDEIAGVQLDYSVEGKARELLINYCQYARSNALDQFSINYREDLTFFQLGEEVKRHEEADDSAV